MGIISFNSNTTGLVGDQVNPRRVTLVTTDNYATVTTAGYLNNLANTFPLLPTDIIDMWYGWTSTDSPGTFGMFTLTFTMVNGTQQITLVEWSNPGNVLLPVVSGDFAVFNGTTGQIKDAGYSPSNAAKTKVVMANGTVIANHIATFTDTAGTLGDDAATAINGGNIQAGLSGTAGTVASFPAGSSNGSFIFKAINNTGGFNSTISNSNIGQATVYSLPDAGASTANILVSSSAAGQTVASSSASATPGTIRALIGSMTESATVMTSGNVVGVRGVVNLVGASGGFVYGVQGKVIPTGTLSGSLWAPAVFGQYDISAATINGAQLACLWGDYGATSGTITSASGMRGIAMTNTTAAVLNAQIYLFGGATNLFELDDNNGGVGATYFVAAGTSAGSAGDTSKCNASKVFKITVNGTNYWIPLFASNS